MSNTPEAKPKPTSKRSLMILGGVCGILVIVYLSLPKSWFFIPPDEEKTQKAAPAQAPSNGAPDLTSLKDAALKAPLDYTARSRYGMALVANGQMDKGLEEFLAAERLAPESPIVHHNLGIYYMNSNQHDKADLAFQKELELAPGDGRAHYFRGVTLQSRRIYKEANNQFELATKLAPNFADTYLALASMQAEKDPPEAIKAHIDNYLKYGGVSKGVAYHLLSRSYRSKQNYPEAIKYAEMAIKENPNAAMFVRNLGQIYTYSRRFDEADKTLRQVAGMIKDPSPVYIEIGMNAQKAIRYPAAEEAFKKALEISPQTGNIHIYLSRLYLLMGNKEAALTEEKAFRAWERKKAEDALRLQKITPPSH